MRRKLFRSFIFLLIIVVSDKIIGSICKKLYASSNDLVISKLRYTIDSTREDVLILGSSRAEYHFIPRILKKTTGLSIYNCGIGGADLLFSKIQLNESLKRYTPRFIVVEVSPSSFFIPNPAETRKLLLPFYTRDTLIYNMLTREGMHEKLKFVSSIYPYNSTLVSLARGLIRNNTDTMEGFIPAKGLIDTTGLTNNIASTYSKLSLPGEGLLYLKELIELCNCCKIKILVVSAPVYQISSNYTDMVNQIKSFCGQFKNLYYIDYSQSKGTYMKKNLFKDNTHLNKEGAIVFSQLFATDFQKIVQP